MASGSSKYIYTGAVIISHIVIETEEPDVTLAGLYENRVNSSFEEIIVFCSFTQLNDLLTCEDVWQKRLYCNSPT